MADPREELRQVKEDLQQLEQQLEAILERQSQLLQRQSDLEEVIRDEARRDKNSGQDWNKTDFPWSKALTDTMERVFHIQQFRPLQLQTMNVTLSGKDCILIMPTGSGKSLCFQLPALVSKGITLVVSPLVSLMEDQIFALQKLKVEAVHLTASSSKDHMKYVQDNMTNQKCPFRLLYVTPEKLAKSKRFMNRLEKMYDAGLFSRIVIDEVHCCSQWGHDFRPDYKFLGVLRRQFPGVPILGLTATATNNVLLDVKKILGTQDSMVYRASFNRHNLFYQVRLKPSSSEATLDEIHKLIKTRFSGQSGIVYCLTQKDTENVAKGLKQRGIQTGFYHANVDPQYRSKVHTRWINNDIQVVVATIAFGMGIDKPDVRFVIHHSISKSMENYYQESGRAGRDDQQSHCILFIGFTDIFRQSTMVFTEQTGQEKLYNMVDYAFNTSRCRRTLIARHFGERWDAANCNMMCDRCNKGPGTATFTTRDVTPLCRDVIKILDQAKRKDTRMTGLKLLEASLGRGATALRINTLTRHGLTDRNMERVLVHLLLDGYLREDFHFTAYSTISYLVPGAKSAQLEKPDHKVLLHLEDTKTTEKLTKSSSSSTATATSSSKTTSTVTSSSEKVQRQKPVIVNVDNSAFIDGGRGNKASGAGGSGIHHHRQSSSKGKEKQCKKSATKRRVVVSSDEDFDFGDVGDVPLSKKQKVRLTGDRRRRDCILIDDSDEGECEASTSASGRQGEVVISADEVVHQGLSSTSSSSEDIAEVYGRQLEAMTDNMSSPTVNGHDESHIISDDDDS